MDKIEIIVDRLDIDISISDILYNIKDKRLPFLLESAKGDKSQGIRSFLGFNPIIEIKAKKGKCEVYGRENFTTDENPIIVLQRLMKKYAVYNDTIFCGGAVGCLSYDFSEWNCEVKLNVKRNVEVYDCYFGIYSSVLEFNHHTQRYSIYAIKGEDLSQWKEVLVKSSDLEKSIGESQIYHNMSKEAYNKAFVDIKDMIRRGYVYEVNLTQQFEVSTEASQYDIYKALCRSNPADFMAYMDFGEYAVLSSSPERFFDCKNRVVTTRPIKGTVPRSADIEEDIRRRQQLFESQKDISELLMIVDLMRNDMAKTCYGKSIEVIDKYRIESYANVHHLVSTIRGTLREECDAWDMLREAFPGGSITGAPKLAAIEAIDKVEAQNRNIYTGSIGYVSFNGNADFNILIRSILKKGKTCYFSGGGAITWDSIVEAEYEESLAKCDKIKAIFR